MAVTPSAFFEEQVPAHFAQVKDQLTEAQQAIDIKVGVALHGDDGGAWTLHYAGGELEVSVGLADDCQVQLEQHVDYWREAVAGEGGLGLMDDFDPTRVDLDRLKPELADRVRQIRGTLQVRVVDGDEETFDLVVRFGPDAPDEPTTTIEMQAEDAAALRAGTLQPQQAFMGGRVRITGDMNLAMQVGSLPML